MAFAKLPPILKTYDLEDVFNFDETSLYCRAHPCKTLNIGRAKGNKKEKIVLHWGFAQMSQEKNVSN